MKDIKCHCGKMATYNDHLKFNGYYINGWVCQCGELYYNPEKAQQILSLNKLKNKKFNIKLSKIRSNLIIRIPKEIGDALNLTDKDEVELSINNKNTLTVKPCEPSLNGKYPLKIIINTKDFEDD